MGPGTALALGLFFLPAWGFWRVTAVALLVQLPPLLLFHRGLASVPNDAFVQAEQREGTDGQQRQVDALVTEVAARAGVRPPAVWLTRSRPILAAGIFERMLVINPGVFNALSKSARRGLIAHELAHEYDVASRERLAIDLAIFVPAGVADAAIILTVFGKMPLNAATVGYAGLSILGKYVSAKFSRINERQADLLAADILGEKESMLALCRELSRKYPDLEKRGWRTSLLRTHPYWQARIRALERHKVRPHPRRLANLKNRFDTVIPTLALISALAVYWLTGRS